MLKTEMRNEASMHIDQMDTLSIIRLINQENRNAVEAVEAALEGVALACDAIAAAFDRGGRLFYIGAGTSGRLGVIDAAECPPTFGVPSEQVVGIIAGGERCLAHAAEAQEDDGEAGIKALQDEGLTEKDVVVGISSSGGAAFVVGALEYANKIGAVSVSLSSNADTPMERVAKIAIVTDTGPEVITGSTRMKSGTAQKLVLNMLSTCAMIKTGKVYENMMINLKPTNRKLKARVIRIVREILGCDENEAVRVLDANGWVIRDAVQSAKKEEQA
ncbi:MAG: N-acetylmuramic acid 6-phosphate etherase [Clostridia bacterium]|nr:N-acetylmuramic acid 6-phosphate etherase [Clostridia bacterium]